MAETTAYSKMGRFFLYLSSSDLSPSDFSVALCLMASFLEKEDLTTREITDITGCHLRTTEKSLSRLKKKGLVNESFLSSELSSLSLKSIYFIKVGEFVKIGVSQDVFKRAEDLQRANPFKLEILGIIEGSGFKEEEEIHEKFKDISVRGEWFKLNKEVIKYIELKCSKPEKSKHLPRWSIRFPPEVLSGQKTTKHDKPAAKGAALPEIPPETQSVLYHEYYNKEQEIENIDHKTSKVKHVNEIQDLSSSVPRNEELKGPDPRFKILVDSLFVLYEKEVGEKLNPLWTVADASMIKRLLKSLPEETPDRIVKSFHLFLCTSDPFDADHVRQSGVVRFWASKITKYLPAKEVDIKGIYAKMTGEKEGL